MNNVCNVLVFYPPTPQMGGYEEYGSGLKEGVDLGLKSPIWGI